MDKSRNIKLNNFFLTYVCSIISSAVAETITFPLDITKTRLQIQNEKGISKRGMFSIIIGIVKEEGLKNLYRGLAPACLRHCIYSGVRVSIYQFIREEIFGRNEKGNFALWKAILAGGISGAIGQFCANPTDLIKVRMQNEGKRILRGEAALYNSIFDAFKKIYREEGIKGLWKGWIPNCQRAIFVQIGDLAFYDLTKQMLLRYTKIGDNPTTHTISSLVASLTSALMGTPADVVKTRIMNQHNTNNGGVFYRSSFHCLTVTIKAEGMLALWSGLIPCWLRMAPWNWTFWLTMEQLLKIAGQASW